MSNSIQEIQIGYAIFEDSSQAMLQPPLGVPNTADVEVFNSAINASEVVDVQPAKSIDESMHLDVTKIISNKIDQIQKSYQNNIQQIHGLMNNADSSKLSTTDLIKLQLKVSELTLSLEVTSKITNKLPQSVETLMRG